MMLIATTAMAMKMPNWMSIDLVTRMSRPLVPVIGHRQRIALGVGVTRRARAGQLADGAAPLQLQPRQIAFPTRPGEQARIEPAQCRIDDERQVRVVTAHPVGDGLLRKRVSGQ